MFPLFGYEAIHIIIAYINDIHSKISIYNINMTIYALSSGPGLSGIAVIRISGDETKKVLFDMTKGSMPLPRVASLKKILDIKTKKLIDEGIVIWQSRQLHTIYPATGQVVALSDVRRISLNPTTYIMPACHTQILP